METLASQNPLPVPPSEPQKHSGLGISSFVISILNGLFLMALVVVAGVLEASTPGGMDENSPVAVVVGLFLIFGLILNVVGLGLGIAGAVQKQKKRIFAVLGLAFNGLACLFMLLLMIVGMTMQP